MVDEEEGDDYSLESLQIEEITDNSPLVSCPPTSLRREEAMRKERENKRRQRHLIRQDPCAYATFREKERKRWEYRKKVGKIKLIAEMTDEEKQKRREYIRQKVKEYRIKNKQRALRGDRKVKK